MQCKYCGAHYRTAELCCPYCGNENIIGKLWMHQRTDAEIAYENERIASGKRWSSYIYDRAVSRVLLVEVLFLIFIIITVIVFNLFRTYFPRLTRPGAMNDLPQQMEELYQEGRIGELEEIFRDYEDVMDMSDPVLKKYRQATLINSDYDRYLNDKLSFFLLSDEEKKEDEFFLHYCLYYGYKTYTAQLGVYSDIDPENIKMLNTYKEEIHACFIGLFKLPEDDFNWIMEQDYIYTEDWDRIEEIVRTANGW